MTMSYYSWTKHLIAATVCMCICCNITLGKVYYVTPTVTTPCPTESCLSLSQFATNSKDYAKSTTILLLLPGNHSLEHKFEINNIISFELSGESNFEAQTIIKCSPTNKYGVSNFNFYKIVYIYVHEIQYVGCTNIFASIGQLTVAYSDFGYTSNTYETTLQVVHSYMNITDCSFGYNSAGSSRSPSNNPRAGSYTVGGAIIITASVVDITDSIFIGNSAERGGALYAECNSLITIFNCTFVENEIHCFYGQVETGFSCLGSSMYCIDSDITIGYSIFDNNVAKTIVDQYAAGGALAFSNSIVTLYQNVYANNGAYTNGGAIYIRETDLRSSNNSFLYNLASGDGGVFYAINAYISDSESYFFDNEAGKSGGVIISYEGIVEVDTSIFFHNSAKSGGVFYMSGGSLTINQCSLSRNTGNAGGVVGTDTTSVFVHDCKFVDNTGNEGGVLNSNLQGAYSDSRVNKRETDELNTGQVYHLKKRIRNVININESLFINNTASYGGVFKMGTERNVTISNCEFLNNKAKTSGSVMYTSGFNTIITTSNFENNFAVSRGVLYLNNASITLTMSILIYNNATQGIIYAIDKSKLLISDTKIMYNKAESGAIYLIGSSVFFCGNTQYLDNVGSVYVYNGEVKIADNAKFINCTASSLEKSNIDELEGGTITLFQSEIEFSCKGNCAFIENRAQAGGAIFASESFVHVYETGLTIANNTALYSGGGIYLYRSELQCHSKSTLKLFGNSAIKGGGGIHSSSSSIKVDSLWTGLTYGGALINFTENEAKKGGGIFLDVNAKLYVQREEWQAIFDNVPAIIFNKNLADFGGAVYVDDSTTSGTCSSTSYTHRTTSSECFVQIMTLQNNIGSPKINRDIHFIDNSATVLGSALFGGLLDRCTVNAYAEVYTKKSELPSSIISGITYLELISNVQLDSVSSSAVKICFCRDNYPNCSYEHPIVSAKKGEKFGVMLVAVDQVNHTIHSANIISSLSSNQGGLGENQLNQTINDNCTELKFEVYSPNPTEELTLYADGPCKDAVRSKKKLNITFSPCTCSVGFQPKSTELNETKCECVCDKCLDRYIATCDPTTHTIVRKGNIWITHLNFTNNQGYLVYSNCPFDYCHAPSMATEINLNLPNGADAQCSKNRLGLLCGICKSDLSLSLGSSNCILCPAHWEAILTVILIVFFLAGILLVTILLSLNLTVAVGTLNGIIFYANIIDAFGSTFLPSIANGPKFATTIIAWLNLEVGFDICFFNGMDAYWKALLHLTFPAYLISLVVIIIVVSERNAKFARLIGRKNPVATLATLLLLSYTKVLNLIITSFSFAILNYPNNSSNTVWLPDASVQYLGRKHALLFVVGLLILFGGVVYTLLLFFWQWLLHYQNKKLLRWIRYQRLHLFLEPYHAPYTFKHRYWTGFLLFIRAILYIIAAANVSRDPGINLLAVGITVIAILLFRMISSGNLYKTWLLDMLEISCFVNLLVFCLIQLFILGGNKDQNYNFIVINVSVSVIFIVFFIIIVYHVLTECFALKSLWKKWIWNRRVFDEDEEAEVNIPGEDYNQPTYSIVDRPSRSDILLPAVVEDTEKGDDENCANVVCTKAQNAEYFSQNNQEKHQLKTPYKLIIN